VGVWQNYTLRLLATIGAAAKEGEGVSLDSKIGLHSNRGELIFRQAHLDLDDAVTARAGQMMVMASSAYAVVMRAIGKFNAVQQPHRDKHFYRSVDRSPSHAGFILSQRLPEIIDGKISSTFGQRDQPFRDNAPRARIALAGFLERRADLLCNHDSLALS